MNANNNTSNKINFKNRTILSLGLKPLIPQNLIFIRGLNTLATMNPSTLNSLKNKDTILFCSSIYVYENLDLKKINDKIDDIKHYNKSLIAGITSIKDDKKL
jgi:hypothetical protein